MAEDKNVSYILGCLLKFCGVLGICQSVSWFVLSALSIATYFCAFNQVDVVDSNLFTQMAFITFFEQECLSIGPVVYPDGKTTPTSYMVLMFFLLFSSVVWFVLSVMLLAHKNSDNKIGKPVKAVWSVLTLFISILDLALAVMIGMDIKFYKDLPTSGQLESTVLSILLTLSMRGFVLWFFNVGSALYILTRVMTNVSENTKDDQQTYASGAPVDAYGSQSPQGYNNNTYDWSDHPTEQIKPAPLNPPFSPRAFPDDRTSNLNYPAHSGYGTPPPVLPKPVNDRWKKPAPLAPPHVYDQPGSRYGGRVPVIPQPDYDAQGLPRAQLKSQPFSYINRSPQQY